MARRCCLHILNTQWCQVAGVTGAGMATGTWCLPAGLGSEEAPEAYDVCHYRSCLLLPVALETRLGDLA
jgi:hypothetical protein